GISCSYRAGVHRDPHSFPTRRSSDLDATDEAMARAYERWHLVSRLERPEGWVYRVAVNWATSVLRRRRRSLHRLYDPGDDDPARSEEHTSELQSRENLVCRLLLEKKN